jgi:hypothetical protein
MEVSSWKINYIVLDLLKMSEDVVDFRNGKSHVSLGNLLFD